MRILLKRYLRNYGLEDAYTLGGLRGGGASFRYLKGNDVQYIQRLGRWMSSRTLGHYLQPAVPLLSTQDWSEFSRSRILQLGSVPWLEPLLAELSAGT